MTASLSIGVEAERAPGLFALVAEDARCVKARDPAARRAFEIVVTYPGGNAHAHT